MNRCISTFDPPLPVLVAGAGPVGLSLALELGQRGVPVVVIDESDGTVAFPAGEAIFSRTMEHLRRWRIADIAREEADPGPDYPHRIVFMTRVLGHLLAEFDHGATNRNPGAFAGLTPEGPAFISKFSLLPLLRRAVEALPNVEVRYRSRVDRFSQHTEGVRLHVHELETGRRYGLDGSYLVGCDGGRSLVRRALGIEMEGAFAQGQNYAVHFRAPALRGLLEEHAHGPAAQVQTLASSRRPYITVVDGDSEWRLSVYLDHAPDPDEAHRWVHEAIGAEVEVEILRAQPWSGHRVVARNYGEGRVFLAGDAAHLLWPKGGFGANTGIGDAVDLGWKLAAVLAGWGGNHLLEGYEAERRPIAVRNVTEASSNWTADAEIVPDPVLNEQSPRGDAARARTGALIERLRGKEFRSIGVQLGYRYRGSPLCVTDGSPEPPDEPDRYVPSTWPGSRAPHAWLPDGSSTLDHFGPGFVLVVDAASPGARPDPEALLVAASRRSVPLAVLPLTEPAAASMYERPLVLVRPDGHVAWRGWELPSDCGALVDLTRGAANAAVGARADRLDRRETSPASGVGGR